jgi:ABC-2 type transport system permease protein
MNLAGLGSVIKVTLLRQSGLSVLRYQARRAPRRLRGSLAMAAVMLWVLVVVEVGLVQVARALVDVGMTVGQPALVFALFIPVVQAMALFIGMLAVISDFYFDTDLPILVPLPVGPGSIVAAKFLSVLAVKYFTAFMILLPAAVAYAPYAGTFAPAPWFWTFLALTFVLIPILPLALAALVSVGLMRVINRRHRDLLLVVVTLALVALTLAFQFQAIQIPPGETASYLRELITTRMGFIEGVGRSFPPGAWASMAVVGAGTAGGTAAFAKLAGASAIAVIVLLYAGGRLFYGGLIGGQEAVARRRRLSRASLTAELRDTSAVRALLRREWRLFMRVPTFVLQGFMSSIIVPAIMAFSLVSNTGGLAPAAAYLKSMQGGAMDAIALIVAAAIAIMGGMNATASTAISREGSRLWISKVIPVRPADQARVKLLFALVGSVICAGPILVAFALVARPGFAALGMAALLGVLASMLGLVLGLAFDLARPILHWTSPIHVVKNNLNVNFPLAVEIAVVGAFSLASRELLKAGVPLSLFGGIFAGILAALLVVAYKYVMRYFEARYPLIEAP